VVNVLALVEAVGPRALAAAEKHAGAESQEQRDGKQERTKVVPRLHLSEPVVLALRTLSWKGYCVIDLLQRYVVLGVMID